MDKELLVIKMFLDDASLQNIKKRTEKTTEEIGDILRGHEATNKKLDDLIKKSKQGEYTNFFYESTLGRPKEDTADKRKIRSIRISDNEMKEMGNISTTAIRERALNWGNLLKLIDYMEREGLLTVPDGFLGEDFNHPLTKDMYKTASSKLNFMAKQKYVMNKIDE